MGLKSASSKPTTEFAQPRLSRAKCTGRPRFGSVRLRFGDGTVQVVPVFGSGGSLAKGLLCVAVYFDRKGRFRSKVSVPGKRFRRFRFRFRFREKRFRRFQFLVSVRFLSHPECTQTGLCKFGWVWRSLIKKHYEAKSLGRPTPLN